MKRILSIDGGGMKGFIPCSMLVELEARTGKPCWELFDMIAGTSIGGILACLLSTGKSATEALKFFTEDGPKIFGSTQFLGNGGVVRPRYSAANIEQCLKNRLGEATLENCATRLLVTSFDLASYQPMFFKSHRPTDIPHLLWQIARATSAAQTYFPAYELDGMVLWDGGNVVNNPTACAVAEGIKIWGDEKIAVLSLGCGADKTSTDAKGLVNAGIVKVGKETMDVLFASNDELADYLLNQFMDDGYFRIQPKLTIPLAIDGAGVADIFSLRSEASWCLRDNSQILDNFISFTRG